MPASSSSNPDSIRVDSEIGNPKKKRKRWKKFKKSVLLNNAKDLENSKTNNNVPNERDFLGVKKRRKLIPRFHRRVINELQCVNTRTDSVINLEDENCFNTTKPPEQSAKNKLLQILAEEKKDKDVIVDHEEEEEVIAQVKVSSNAKINQQQNFFQRGSDFVRRSLRKINLNISSSSKGTNLDSSLHNKTLASDSQDSGLGEDSDGEATSPRTSTPLEKSSLNSNSFQRENTKKHVVIKEPSLSILHSERRLLRLQQQKRVVVSRPEIVKILPKLQVPTKERENVGSVRNQWQYLNELAFVEVIKHVDCDEKVTRMIFNTNSRRVSKYILELPSGNEVAEVIHTVYKILYFKWTDNKENSRMKHLSIIVHNVQKFLILVVDIADLDMDNRLKFARYFRALLSESVKWRYQNIEICLEKTRKLYIDFWCCLLCSSI